MKTSSFTHQAFEQHVVCNHNVLLWTESFGNKENPTIVLIMGSNAQAIFWPQKFCENLANKGFFIIRYDHRDTGLSTYLDCQQEPYTLLDMAKDVVILDDYKINQAHVVGTSAGGAIATILEEHFSERIKTLTLGMTSPDLQVSIAAFHGKNYNSTLSPPKKNVIDATKALLNKPAFLIEMIHIFKKYAQITSGTEMSIDDEFLHQLALQSFQRTKNEASVNNHFLALQSSYQIHRECLKNIKISTLIIHTTTRRDNLL